MILKYEDIITITKGAVRLEEEPDGIHFYRFTKEQEELYKEYNDDFYNKSFSCTGVRFSFRTDSSKMNLSFELSKSSSRSYFAFDIFVDGEYHSSLCNFDDNEIPEMYPHKGYELGEFSEEFILGEGEKEITVYFPFSVKSVLKEMSLDDGAYIKPVKYDKKILMFGDSITHGYDALHTSGNYATRLADALGAELINKGIGGEIFFPALAKSKDDFEPEYITVAYGTNDWNRLTDPADFENNCREFYEALSKNYPNTKIFAITPIWRKDCNEERTFGEFSEVEKIIRDVTGKIENVICISGFDLVPHREECFGDLYLHPNNEGFEYYFKNLYDEIKKYLNR